MEWGEELAATRRSYDAVAARYTADIADELAGKPLDAAFLDALAVLVAGAGGGPVGDLGAGPAHLAARLAQHRGVDAFGADVSLEMLRVAGRRTGLPMVAGDLSLLPLRSGSLAGAVCAYAVIHLDDEHRRLAYCEVARVLRPGAHALVAFHTADADRAAGEVATPTEFLGEPVDLRFRFLDPTGEVALATAAGLEVTARLDRVGDPAVEHPSDRTLLLLRRPLLASPT